MKEIELNNLINEKKWNLNKDLIIFPKLENTNKTKKMEESIKIEGNIIYII